MSVPRQIGLAVNEWALPGNLAHRHFRMRPLCVVCAFSLPLRSSQPRPRPFANIKIDAQPDDY